MNGLVIAAPRSGSGKTTVTLGLLAALRRRGIGVAPAKTGPDYIDTTILARAAGRDAINLDPWAMGPNRLRALATAHATAADLLLVEGVMGLFDGAADGRGSTAGLAATLGLPVILVLDAERQSQSIAALAHGFATWRSDITVAGLIVNRAASARHEAMLRSALAALSIPLLGVLPRRENLALPDRHLGLVLPDEVARFDEVVSAAAEAVEDFVDLNHLLALSALSPPSPLRGGAGGGGGAVRTEVPPATPTPHPSPQGGGEPIAAVFSNARHLRNRNIEGARSLRNDATPPERHMWQLLHAFEGHKFRRQVPIGPYIADFACHGSRLIVELDGETHFAPGAEERDAHRSLALRQMGYQVLRFTNSDIITNTDGVWAVVAAALSASAVGSPLHLPPLGQCIAIARDDAFAFLYPHWLNDWRTAGAELSFFSPLADEAPDPSADAVFLPGGYPELHAARLSAASTFLAGLHAAATRGALVYGECGGFMVLGTTLTDKSGTSHPMSGLLRHETRIDRPKRILGYRRLMHASPLPFPAQLTGHEFHYSSARRTHGTPLFTATDALGEELPAMGIVQGRVMGSYAHVIDVA